MVNGRIGQSFHSNSGIRKGILFLHIFLLFVKNIWTDIFILYSYRKKCGIGIKLFKGYPNIPSLMFADDWIICVGQPRRKLVMLTYFGVLL